MLTTTEKQKIKNLSKSIIMVLFLFLLFLKISPANAVSSLQMNFSGKIVTGDGLDISHDLPGCVKAEGVDTCAFQIKYYDDSGTDPGTLLGRENFLDVELGDYRGYFNLKFGKGTFDGSSPAVYSNIKDIFLNEEDVYIEVLFDKGFDGEGVPDFEYTNENLERFVVSHPPTLERMAVGASPYSISTRGAIDEFQLKVKTTPVGSTKGLIYFDGGDNVVKAYDGTVWQSLVYASVLGVQWGGTESETFFTGNVGIGTESPLGKLDVVDETLTVGLNNTTVAKGTTNLLTANQSGVETDATGFTQTGSSISRNLDYSWEGDASLRVVTNNAAVREGVYFDANIDSDETYSASLYAKGSGTIYLRFDERTAGSSVGITDGSAVTLTSDWQKLTVTREVGATGVVARIYAVTQAQETATFYIDGMQLEKSSSATPWILGGQTRAAGDIVSMGRLLSLGSGNSIFQGNVGIGTSTPDTRLSILGDFSVEGNIKVVGGLSAGSGAVVHYDAATGYLVDGSASSARYKKNVNTYGSVLSDLNNLELVRFTWNEQTMSSGKEDVGMIAEDVAKHIPELVNYNSFGQVEGLKYEKMGAYAIAGLQELSSDFYSFKDSLENAEEKIYTSSEEMEVGTLVSFDIGVVDGIRKFENPSSVLLGIVSEVFQEEDSEDFSYKIVPYEGSGIYDVLVSRSLSEDEIEVGEEGEKIMKKDILEYVAGSSLSLGSGEMNVIYSDDLSSLNIGYILETLNFEEESFAQIAPVYLTHNPLNFGSGLISLSSLFTSENGRLSIGNSSVNFVGNDAMFGSVKTRFLNISDKLLIYEDENDAVIEIVKGEDSYDLLEKVSDLENRLKELEGDEL